MFLLGGDEDKSEFIDHVSWPNAGYKYKLLFFVDLTSLCGGTSKQNMILIGRNPRRKGIREDFLGEVMGIWTEFFHAPKGKDGIPNYGNKGLREEKRALF